ncbi:MAG: hypothetical protein M0C28_43530 [Candidatus Moduliflexus flocculans]|nr:hypothetical protein [Candidatus Moduliflexus flocculans]
MLRRQLETFDDLGKPSGLGSAYSFLAVRTGTCGLLPVSRPGGEPSRPCPPCWCPGATRPARSRKALVVTLKRDEGRPGRPCFPRRVGRGRDPPRGMLAERRGTLRPGTEGPRRSRGPGRPGPQWRCRSAQNGLQSELEDTLPPQGAGSSSGSGPASGFQELLEEGPVPVLPHREDGPVLRLDTPGRGGGRGGGGDPPGLGGRCHIEMGLGAGGPGARAWKPRWPCGIPASSGPSKPTVRNFAVPEYGDGGPHPFAAAAYLAMFSD